MTEKNPKLIVAALIEKDNKFLLTKEILESGTEYWIIPGGGVEFGENLADAVKREIKEEIGLEIEIIDLINFKESINLRYDYHTLIFFFRAKPLNDTISLEDKVLEAKFFTKEEAKKLNLVESAKWLFEKHL